MASVKGIDESGPVTFRRYIREERRDPGQHTSAPSLPSPFLLTLWFGLVTGLLEVGLVYCAIMSRLVVHRFPPGQPALPLDDPARQPGDLPRLGNGRRRPGPDLEA